MTYYRKIHAACIEIGVSRLSWDTPPDVIRAIYARTGRIDTVSTTLQIEWMLDLLTCCLNYSASPSHQLFEYFSDKSKPSNNRGRRVILIKNIIKSE